MLIKLTSYRSENTMYVRADTIRGIIQKEKDGKKITELVFDDMCRQEVKEDIDELAEYINAVLKES